MKSQIQALLQLPCEWLHAGEQGSRIVLSSRIRLARNLSRFPFPGWARRAEREKVLALALPAAVGLTGMKEAVLCDSMDHFTPVEKQVLVEEHLISREHAGRNAGSGVVVNRARTISLMINEEDHFRIQAFKGGLQLKAAWRIADKADTELDEKLEFAFSPKLGYLTACPTNVGTGLRASAMMHLPGLVLSEQIGQIIKAVNRIGLAVRGLYGEGTEALGNLFQISNQMTLGESEEEILERMHKVIAQVVQHEENARQKLMEERPRLVIDQVSRAYGILGNAYTISSKEALNLLSLLRLGIDMGLFPDRCRAVVDEECLIQTQPAHLQLSQEKKLSTGERDALRADFLRARLRDVPPPETGQLSTPLHS